jgi:ABC-type multidrug transport system fused ATPase/permease subunit
LTQLAQRRILSPVEKDLAASVEAVSQSALEVFTNIKTVAAFTTEDIAIQNFNKRLNVTSKQVVRKSFSAGIFVGLTEGVLFLMYFASVLYGGKLVQVPNQFTSINLFIY